MLRRGDHHPSTSPHSTQRILRGILSVLTVVAWLWLGTPALHSQVTNSGFGGPTIQLGDAIVLPGETHAWVPVLISSEVEILSWQMGLEYDELLLSFDEISFTGTASELLQPIPITTPILPPYQGIQVIYGGGESLPAGNEVLAAYLKLSVIDIDLIPDNGNLAGGVGGVANESSPLLLTDLVGNSVVPIVIPGTITVFDFPLILIESRTGTALDTTLTLPIRAWTDGPATTFAMGLEYDEWIVCELTIQGSDFDDITQGQWTIDETITPTGVTITLTSTSGALPALSGETLGHLVVALPPTAPGLWILDLLADECTIDQNPVGNLVDGELSWLDHFIRGDANLDSTIDLADANTLLAGTYMGVTLPCMDAADVNDDGALDISDTVSVLQFLFGSSPPPPPPFTAPGADPTDDQLDCL